MSKYKDFHFDKTILSGNKQNIFCIFLIWEIMSSSLCGVILGENENDYKDFSFNSDAVNSIGFNCCVKIGMSEILKSAIIARFFINSFLWAKTEMTASMNVIIVKDRNDSSIKDLIFIMKFFTRNSESIMQDIFIEF